MRLASLVALWGTSAVAGTICTYDVELFSPGQPAVTMSMKLLAEGPRLRAEPSRGPFSAYVVDTAAQVVSWTVPSMKGCYQLPMADVPKLQIKAIKHYLASKKDELASFSPETREQVVSQANAAIADLEKPRLPRTRTFTWKGSKKLKLPCELYDATEGGLSVGEACFQVKGAPKKSLTLNVGPGEWWQGQTHFLQEAMLPVLLEERRDGVVVHRATLREVQHTPIAPAVFVLGPDCKSGLLMEPTGP